MIKNGEVKCIEKVATVLGRKTKFKGTMKFTTSLKILGNFNGNIESDGFLYIDEGAVVKADIRVGTVVIGGIVRGNIEAVEKLEMLSTGQVYGNVKTLKLRIADGVVFEGKCEMMKSGNSINIFSKTIQDIKDKIQTA